MSWRREALLHLGARVGSALASSAAFALVARHFDVVDTKRLFSLLFICGFAHAALRSFSMFVAGLRGGDSRTRKARRVYRFVYFYCKLSPIFFAALAALLLYQSVLPNIGSALLLSLLLVISGLDTDQLQAALGRAPRYSLLFAVGNIGSVAILALGNAQIELGVLAIAMPLATVAMGNATIVWRLRKSNILQRKLTSQTNEANNWSVALLMALYDGIVLNIPFLAGKNLDALTIFNLSISLRLYSSAQPFFPLIQHWASAGRINRLSLRSGLPEPLLYGLALAGSGWLASLLFAAIFISVSNENLTWLQYLIFSGLLIGISILNTTARYLSHHVNHQRVSIAAGGLLILFGSIWHWLPKWVNLNAAAVGALQCAALVALPVCTLWLSRQNQHNRKAP